MSYDSQASSRYGAKPFELYWFTMSPIFPAGIAPQNWYLTSGDQARTYLTNTYAPTPISRGEIQQDKELQSGSLDIEIPSDHPLAQQFLRGAPLSPIALTIYAGHDGDSEVIVGFSGRVRSATHQGGKTKLHVSPDHQSVRKAVPCVDYQHSCVHVVYDSGCGLVAGNNAVLPMVWDAHVSAINSDGINPRKIWIGAGSFIDYWSPDVSGNSHWTSGEPSCTWGMIQLPSGLCLMIEEHTSIGTMILQRMDAEVQVGTAIKIFRGCGRTWKHCKFINPALNFIGFEGVPSSGNPFSGGLF